MELTGAVAEIAQLQQARRSCIVECMGCCSWLHLRTSYFHRRHPYMAEALCISLSLRLGSSHRHVFAGDGVKPRSMCKAHALPLLWQGILLPLAIAHSGSAKPAHVHIAYDGSASTERTQESQLLRRNTGLKPEGSEEAERSLEAQQSGWFVEDEVESTIVKAQTYDFDKSREQMLRHIHYTAATSPTGKGPGPAKDTWHISSHGPPVSDEAEGRIVEDQKHAEKAGLPADFKIVPPVAAVMKKPPVSATLPPNLPKDCFKARHSTDIRRGRNLP